MYVLLSVFAMTGPSGAEGQQGSPLGMFLPLILIFLIMWLLIFRPQAKKQKETQKMIQAVQSGDEILTIGGIYGTIKGFKDEEKVAIIEVDKNVKLEILRSSIARNISAEKRNVAAKK